MPKYEIEEDDDDEHFMLPVATEDPAPAKAAVVAESSEEEEENEEDLEMLEIICEGAQADLHHEQRKRLLKDMNKQMDSKLMRIKE